LLLLLIFFLVPSSLPHHLAATVAWPLAADGDRLCPFLELRCTGPTSHNVHSWDRWL